MDLDSVDRQLLTLLRHDGRAAVRDLAKAVGLSTAPVSRRISRMEQAGVIRGYTALVDDRHAGTLEAFTELRLTGDMETDELAEIVRKMPEVVEFSTIAGDPDALVRIVVEDVDHLQRVVNAFRRTGKLTGTKTLIVMKSWSRIRDEAERPSAVNRGKQRPSSARK